MSSHQFDSAYYERFYGNPRTRVITPAEMACRATTIAALVTQLEIPVKRILDAGCGLGLMRKTLLDAFPSATYTGIEVSEHLCKQMGWVQSTVAAFRPRGRFDLIICNDVLQYSAESEATRAMANLARLCRGAMYLHVPTTEDWRHNADLSYSDTNVHVRDAAWYRARLARKFHFVGFGLHVRRGVPFVQWELERFVPIAAASRSR